MRRWIASTYAQARFGGRGRRFAPRNDGGENMIQHSRGAFRPSFASSSALENRKGRREGRVAAAPGAAAQRNLRKRA